MNNFFTLLLLSIFSTSTIFAAQPPAQTPVQAPMQIPVQIPNYKPVFSYRKKDGTNFFMTSNAEEAKSIGMQHGPQKNDLYYLGSQFAVADVAVDATWVPLYRYFNGIHFYTTDPNEIGATDAVGKVGKYNYKFEGIVGYISKGPRCNMVPLHRFYFPKAANSHQYVLENNPDYWLNRGNPDVKYEDITGYVYPNF